VKAPTAAAQDTAFTYQGRVTDNGTNFTGPGLFKFALVTSTNGQGATATAVMNGVAPNEFVDICTVVNGGSGYATAPAVSFSGGGGSGATAQANLSGGVVTSITVLTPGSGYSSAPTVTIAPPPPDFTTWWSNDGTSTNGSQPLAGVMAAVNNGLFTVALGNTTVSNMTAIAPSLFATQSSLQLVIWFNDGVNGFALLTPPQNLTPAPYAISAGTVSGIVVQSNTNGAPNVIAGSPENFVAGGVVGATISGGGATDYDGEVYSNSVTGDFGTVAGGLGNTASGDYATVGGGYENLASGSYSFAAGYYAEATNMGAFVWADTSGPGFASTAENQFSVRATGGIQLIGGIYGNLVVSNTMSTFALYGAGNLSIISDDGLTPGITVNGGPYSGHMRFRNALEVWPDAAKTSGGYLDVRNLSGIQTIWMSGTNGNITCTSLTQTSDRNAKQDFAPVSPSELLDKVLELPVSEWSYKVDAGTRHIGPVAQDFYSIFNIGTDEKHIAPIDEGGVAFAAIQGLNQKMESESAELRSENAALKNEVAELKALVQKLASSQAK